MWEQYILWINPRNVIQGEAGFMSNSYALPCETY